jgi:hypothetical protein
VRLAVWGVSIVVKDHFLYHQARVSAGLLPSGAAVLCSNSLHSLLPCVQRLKEQTTLRISKCLQQCISCRLHGLELVCVRGGGMCYVPSPLVLASMLS